MLHKHTDLFDNLAKARAKARAENKNLRIWRMYLCVYGDGFQTRKLSTTGLDGLYLAFGNKAFDSRTVGDIHELGLVPPGVSLVKYFDHLFVPQIQGLNRFLCFLVSFYLPLPLELENGVLLSKSQQESLLGLDENDLIFVTGGMGVYNADMVDAQKFAAAKGVGNATKPDRMSHAARSQKDERNSACIDMSLLWDDSIFGDLRKTLQQLRHIRSRLAKIGRKGVRKKLLSIFGLQLFASPGESIEFDPTRNIPPEPLHSEVLGVLRSFFIQFWHLLTDEGKRRVNQAFREVLLPQHWNLLRALELSSEGKLTTGAMDLLHLAQVAPFALRDFLVGPSDDSYFVRSAVTEGRARKQQIYAALVSVSRELFFIYCRKRPASTPEEDRDSAQELHEVVRHTRTALDGEAFPGRFSNSPNYLTGVHYREAAQDQGHPRLLSVALQEMKHGTFKKRVPSLSGRNDSVELLQMSNSLQAVRFLRRVVQQGALDHPAVKKLPDQVRRFLASGNPRLEELLSPLTEDSKGYNAHFCARN